MNLAQNHLNLRCIEHVVPYMKMNELTNVIYDNDQGEGVHRINAGSRGSIVNLKKVCFANIFERI